VPAAGSPATALARVPRTDELGVHGGVLQLEPPPALQALLALDGDVFIAAAYGAVLGRLPDETGLASAQAAMARGFSKIAVLGSLHRSPEGRASGRVIPGLRARALAHAAYRLPVLGGVARVGSAVLRRSGVSRRLVWLPSSRRGLGRGARLAGVDARLAALEALHLQAERAQAGAVATCQAQVNSLSHKVAALGEEQALQLDRLARRLDAVVGQVAALDERSVTLADDLEAQRSAAGQIRADLEAEQRRGTVASNELRRDLDATYPALSGFGHRIARQA